MKKLVMFAVAVMVAFSGLSATLDDLYKYVEKCGGSVIELPQEMMAMMMQQQAGKEAQGLKDIESMKMGMIENATNEQKTGLKAIVDQGLEGYTDMNEMLAAMGQKNDDESVKILFKMDPKTEKFTSFVIVTLEDQDNSIGVVQMDGQLTLDDLSKVK